MSQIRKILICFLITFVFNSVNASEVKFVEGEHYKTLTANELSKTQELKEFFSYYCGHCFMFRSLWNELHTVYPSVDFHKVPVSFLGGPNGPLSQKAFAVATIMGVEEDFSNELFNQIHKMRKTELSAETLGDIAAYVGADKNKFLEQYNSFVALSHMANYNQETDKDEIQGVPTIMVNNKYIILKAEKDQINDLISFLLNKDGVPQLSKSE